MTARTNPGDVTPSLHTATAVTRVAAYIQSVKPMRDAEKLAVAAFAVLGYDIDPRSKTDKHVQRVVKECKELLDCTCTAPPKRPRANGATVLDSDCKTHGEKARPDLWKE